MSQTPTMSENMRQTSTSSENMRQTSTSSVFSEVRTSLILESSWTRPENFGINFNVHFLNICRTEPSAYTCAVDSFLEICFVSFAPFIERLVVKSEFFHILYICFQGYQDLLKADCIFDELEVEYHLAALRQPFWDILIENCGSFANKNSDAQFSEIFSSVIFSRLLHEERILFQTRCRLDGFCNLCNKDLSRHIKNEINFLSEVDQQLSHNLNWLELMLDPLFQNKSMSCTCGFSCSNVMIGIFLLPKILPIELDSTLINEVTFKESILINNKTLILKALVKHHGLHFSSAISSNGRWNYIDDLQEKVCQYSNLQNLFANHLTGWFFGVYVEQEIEDENLESIDFVINSESEVKNQKSLKQKDPSDKKDYPLRSKFKKVQNKIYYGNNKSIILENNKIKYRENNFERKKENYQNNKNL